MLAAERGKAACFDPLKETGPESAPEEEEECEEEEEEKDGEEEHDCKQATKQSCSYLNFAIVSVFFTAIVVVCMMLNVSPLRLVFNEIDSVVEGLHEPVVLGNGWAFQNPGPVSIVRVDSQDFRNKVCGTVFFALLLTVCLLLN